MLIKLPIFHLFPVLKIYSLSHLFRKEKRGIIEVQKERTVNSMARKLHHKKLFRANRGFDHLSLDARVMRVLKHQKDWNPRIGGAGENFASGTRRVL